MTKILKCLCCKHVNAIKNVNCNNILQTRCCLIIIKTNLRRIQVLLYHIIQDHMYNIVLSDTISYLTKSYDTISFFMLLWKISRNNLQYHSKWYNIVSYNSILWYYTVQCHRNIDVLYNKNTCIKQVFKASLIMEIKLCIWSKPFVFNPKLHEPWILVRAIFFFKPTFNFIGNLTPAPAST